MKIYSAIILMTLLSANCFAEDYYQYLDFKCDGHWMILEPKAFEKPQPVLNEPNHSLVSMSDLKIYKNEDTRPIVVATKKVYKDCLDGGHLYKVTIEPEIFNANVLGRCGASSSIAVTVHKGDKEILPRTAFYKYCDVKTWITKIRINMLYPEINIEKNEQSYYEN